MSRITTHVLDTTLGKPAAGIAVRLEKRQDEAWLEIADDITDIDGRCRNLTDAAVTGVYRLTFATSEYFFRSGRSSIYPEIYVSFQIAGEQHYHLPLLLSDNCYTTYRGS